MKLLLHQVVMVPNKSRFIEQNGMMTYVTVFAPREVSSGPYLACPYGLIAF